MSEPKPPYSNYNIGLTLRDYFAAHAPINELRIFPDVLNSHGDVAWFEKLSRAAYAWADAMLAEKAKREAR